ncbi:MAG: hypothetical protein ACLPKB_08780 [Xanthobacteraceae bacterium]
MRIRTSARVFAVSATLFFAFLDTSAIAQSLITQASQNDASLELNPFLHPAATSAPAIPKQQATPALRGPRTAPPLPQASRLAVATPSVKVQKAVKQEPPTGVKQGRPEEKVAGGRPANTREVRIAQPLAPRSADAAAVRTANRPEGVADPVDVAPAARQIPEAPDPVVAVARTAASLESTELNVAAGPPVQANASNGAEAGPISPPPGAASTAASASEPVVAVVGTVADGPPVQSEGGDPAEVKPMPMSPSAANVAESTPDPVVVGTVADGPPVQPNGSNPAEAKQMATPPGAANTEQSAPEPAVAVVEAVAAGQLVQPEGNHPAEAKQMSAPLGATKGESAPEPLEVTAPAHQAPETPEPVVTVVRTAASVELKDLHLAAWPTAQPNAGNPAGLEPLSAARAPSATAASRVVMLGLGAAIVVGLLAWGVRRQLTLPAGLGSVRAWPAAGHAFPSLEVATALIPLRPGPEMTVDRPELYITAAT